MLNKKLIAQIQCMNIGNMNSMHAGLKRPKLTQKIPKMIFVKQTKIVVKDFAAVMLPLMMRMVSN